MKQLISLNHDYILEAKFHSDSIRTANGSETDWIDDKKNQANGKNLIENISVLVQKYDANGYPNGDYTKVWIDKRDIIELAKRIQEIESIAVIGEPGDDLPF